MALASFFCRASRARASGLGPGQPLSAAAASPPTSSHAGPRARCRGKSPRPLGVLEGHGEVGTLRALSVAKGQPEVLDGAGAPPGG